MNQKSLIVLSLVTVVVVAAAVLTQREGEAGSSTEQETGRFLPDLLDRINDVERIEIRTADEELVAVKQAEDWVLETTGGYPARFETVKAALVGLAELERLEGKTSSPEHYAALGVESPDTEGAASTEVVLEAADGSRVAAVILGNRKPGRSPQLYVRDPEAEQAWLVGGRVNVQADPASWMERQFANIGQDRMAEIVIEREGEEPLRVYKQRPSDLNFLVADVPEDKELVAPTIANSIAAGLSYLSLEEVRSAEDFEFDAGRVATATFTTWDGMVVVVETTEVDGTGWIRLRAEVGEAPEIAPAEVAEGEEASEPEAYDGATPEEIADEVAELNATVEGWVYKVPTYKLASFEKRLEELIREPAPEPEAQPADGGVPEFDALSIDDAVGGDLGSFDDLMNAPDDELLELDQADHDHDHDHAGHDHGDDVDG